MGSYVPSTQAQREQMLRAVGLENVMDLYRDVPEEMLLRDGLDQYRTVSGDERVYLLELPEARGDTIGARPPKTAPTPPFCGARGPMTTTFPPSSNISPPRRSF